MFERESKEKLVDKMVAWSRATNPKIIDFRRGSVIRTIYSAVGLIVEGLYDRMYRSMKSLIETNVYAIIGFDKLQASLASGIVTIGRKTPADKTYIIPRGTELVAEPTQFRPPVVFRTTDDATLREGYTTVTVPVVCSEAGEIGNVEAGAINQFVQKPIGIDTVTNLSGFDNGEEEESPEEQKRRFQEFMEAKTSGSLQAIEYGTRYSSVLNEDGEIVERVVQALALDDLPARPGEVDVYAWDGVGEISEELRKSIMKNLYGYYREDGKPVYGYKNGGTIINLYSAKTTYVTMKLNLEVESWASEEDVKKAINKEIDTYFARLRLHQSFIQTELEARIKFIEGVKDVKLYTSTEGDTGTFTMDNIHTTQTGEILISAKPILYM